jgi:hypothetical protein
MIFPMPSKVKHLWIAAAVLLGILILISLGPTQNSAPTGTSTARYAVSEATCEENLRRFRANIKFFNARGETPEHAEAVAEHLETNHFKKGYGYAARTEAELIAHGCRGQ